MLSEADLRRHKVAMELVGKELDVLIVLVDSGLKRRMGERRRKKRGERREGDKEREGVKKEEKRRDGRQGREGEEKREKVGDHSLGIYQCELLLN